MDGWLLAERAKELIPTAGQAHDRRSTLRALDKVQDSLGLIPSVLTPDWNVKDPQVTAVHTATTEKRSSSDPLYVSALESFLGALIMGAHGRRSVMRTSESGRVACGRRTEGGYKRRK